MIPTFFGITVLSFFIINMAPGGPIEQRLQAMKFGMADSNRGSGNGVVNQEIIEEMKKHYGLDKPVHVRYFLWLRNISKLDFGNSFVYEEPVMGVIKSKLPVSLQFGFASLFLTYLICIPLGVAKAVRANSFFDHVTGLVLYFFYAIPSLIMGILLITFFAGGSFWSWFPIGGLSSDDYDTLTRSQQIWDRAHHFVLPLFCYVVGSFASLVMLQRNSMLEVIRMDYVRTARAKGLKEGKVLYKHALRNALIPIATGLGSWFGVFLAGSLIIETLFNLDGIGLLSYQSTLQRDYNVLMALIFLSSMVLLIGRLFSDIIYVIIDPRIDYT
ncbi:MAG: ABC transporter permease subunit [Pseudobdellovibrionaceae bacterium]